MGKFLATEKPKQSSFKLNSNDFTSAAKVDGIYKGNPYPFCIPQNLAEQNLYSGIRNFAMDFFHNHKIKWHDGQDGKPSNHMCDSQVCCVNFLFPFTDKPDALAQLLKPVFPTIKMVLPIEGGQFVTFEWIGAKNYLNEKISRNGQRTRGANFTSADAAVMFEDNEGRKQIVLIEWKYTESYYKTFLGYAKSGTDRTQIYAPLYNLPNCPIDKNLLPGLDALFYEPFYQLMRQQLLAHEMEKANELDADIVSVLHIAPRNNTDFCRITSPALQLLGISATDIWSKLLVKPNRFTSVYTEAFFGSFPVDVFPNLNAWWNYIKLRYSWM